MKGWPAAWAALVLCIPPHAGAAEDGNGAARELARKTAAWAGRSDSVAMAWRNVSSLGSAELSQARGAFEAAFKETGGRISDAGTVSAQITLSENSTQYLLVEEARKGDDRQVWIAGWNRGAYRLPGISGVTLEQKLVWEQNEPILDVRTAPAGMLVLSPGKIGLYVRSNGDWTSHGLASFGSSRPWPRDPRALLRVNGPAFQVYAPGLACTGTTEPALAIDCKTGDDPWVLESGSRWMLLAHFAPNRNFFDGPAVAQSGLRKTVTPFYTAAAVEEQGKPLWLLATVDGYTRIFDAVLEPGGTLGPWGSDIAATEAKCGGGAQVLATRPGDGSEPDSVQAFAVVNRSASALTPPVNFPGPVTALWSTGATSAIAVAHNLATGKYEAYVLTVVCGS